jgi:hypothetical protein
VASATLFVSAAGVTPLVVPWSVVVEVLVVEPMAMFVAEPMTPFVAILTVLLDPDAVAPVPRLYVAAVVAVPRFNTAPLVVIEPSKVVVVADTALPMAMLVVEPVPPAVPILMALVEAETVAPVPILIVEAAVDVPNETVAPEKVFVPEKVLVEPSGAYC